MAINFAAFMVSICYPDVLAIFGIFGGIFASTVGLIIPFLIRVRMGETKGEKWYNLSQILHRILLVFIIFVGAGSTYVSVFKPDF